MNEETPTPLAAKAFVVAFVILGLGVLGVAMAGCIWLIAYIMTNLPTA
jgi:hypothetical protein